MCVNSIATKVNASILLRYAERPAWPGDRRPVEPAGKSGHTWHYSFRGRPLLIDLAALAMSALGDEANNAIALRAVCRLLINIQHSIVEVISRDRFDQLPREGCFGFSTRGSAVLQ